MKIAFTGASSTGKTSLAKALITAAGGRIKTVSVDARKMLKAYGVTNVDELSPEVYSKFQLDYIAEKTKLEKGLSNFITERSFVDVFAFWEVNCSKEVSSINGNIKEICREASRTYDIHVYFPFGLLPFVSDGYRSENMAVHRAIDSKIKSVLAEWDIKSIVLYRKNMKWRVEQVKPFIKIGA